MRSWPMLMQRGSTWYFRRIVPLALRPMMEGKREIWRSLRTSDFNEAKLLSLREGQEVEHLFQSLRKQSERAQVDPEAFARQYESRRRSADAEWRLRRDIAFRGEDDGSFESARRQGETLDAELDALTSAIEDHRASLRLQDSTIVSTLLDEVLTEQRLHVPPQRRKEFAFALLKARLRVLEVSEKRTRDEEVVFEGITVDGLLDAFLKERKLPSKSEAEFRAAFRRFTAIVGGEDTAASAVTKKECRAYKESLLAAPSSRSLAKDGTLSPASVKKLMGIVSTIWRYGVSQGLVESNPFEGITRVVRGDTAGVSKRLPYDRVDLKTIFGSDASTKLDGAKKFIPLIALYSGARLEEIHGLRVQDIREVEGVTCFAFEPHEERRLKTASSRRLVPIHGELVKHGLLDYAKAQAEGLLFPVKAGPHGKLSGAFSKWWRRFTDECGVRDARKVFHSLRHAFADALRRAKVESEIRSALLGHSTASGTMTARYGSGHDLKALQEAVNAVRYEGVTLLA